ncbi:Virus X resistance protein-like, coiled-coil domain [Sesbania bispinosa]|nr:Virus X resistance protein-like, coiled-coil domain [Sesbania bispinosa]
MAQYFFDVVNSLVGRLYSYAYEEAFRAYGLNDELQGIKDTLSIVKGVLLDAEMKKDQNHGLREWLMQVQNICYDAEDVFDEFESQNVRNQDVQASGSKRRKVSHFFSSSNPIVFKLWMSGQVKNIRDRLDKVIADGNRLGLERRINVEFGLGVQRRAMTYSHVDASDVIGREDDREEIIKLLMQPHPHGDGDGDKSLCVIPIVGIGGLGKTTLAKFVFNDKRTEGHFQLKMWVCVSNDFDIKQIVIKIIHSANDSASAPTIAHVQQENINHLDIQQLVHRLKHKLSGQKFLLVLDDIWNDDRAKWLELKDLIKVGATGSKILVTTRSNSIASMMGTVDPYVLKGLSPNNCLSLFVKWAFKEGEEKRYPILVEIGKEIVGKCQGVPLALKTLGSSLFSKFDLEKWEFIRDSDLWNLEQKEDDILPALKLSYDEMSSHLRHCFIYFSLFPKGYLFEGYYVKNLWLALGLLQSLTPNGSQKADDITRQYIDELSARSFIQEFIDFGNNMYNFKVHDLVHDLAMYVSKEEFVVVNSHTRNIPEQARHLSIFETDSLGHDLFQKSRSVRTILFPIEGVGLDSETILNTWLSRYKYLRYLDLSDSSFETLPNSIVKLEHLRFLDLSCNLKIKRLPHSICKLHNLQCLSIKGCMELETLPKGLGKLINLGELHVTTKQSLLPHNEFASLSNLQRLVFCDCDNLKILFNRVQLTSLEELIVLSCGSLESLPLYILPYLEALVVSNCKRLNLSLKDESPMRNSQMVQQSINHENSIQRMRMKMLFLDGFPELETLPQWIEGAANTLQILVILDCPNLEMLPECLTTMTHLKYLHIFNCPKLSSLPSDMHRLTAHLEVLVIMGCPELCRKCQPESGEYWPIIAHIKKVNIEKPRE